MIDDRLIVEWAPEAESLLRRRGNFARQQIQQEFEKAPRQEALQFDPDRRCFVTPVANRRYSVVWREDPIQKRAIVSAVVPTQFSNTNGIWDLKRRVLDVVRIETNGRVTLDP